MPAYPKAMREVDTKHLSRIRKLPCIVKNSGCFGQIVVPYAQPEGRMQMSISEWIPSIMVPDWVDIFKCYAMPRINILFQRTASKASD